MDQNVGVVADGKVTGVHIENLRGDVSIIQGEKRVALFAGVPAMPVHFVGRDELAAGLAARLIAAEERSMALVGLPGVGKTTLATALAHHKKVLAHFKYGVLWASLGPRGKAFNVLGNWAQALGKDIAPLTELEDRLGPAETKKRKSLNISGESRRKHVSEFGGNSGHRRQQHPTGTKIL